MTRANPEGQRWAFGGSESANPRVTAMVRRTEFSAIVVAKGLLDLSRGLRFLCPDCEVKRIPTSVFILS
jgi:hypothetical protein